jgi:hypothetical protein
MDAAATQPETDMALITSALSNITPAANVRIASSIVTAADATSSVPLIQ